MMMRWSRAKRIFVAVALLTAISSPAAAIKIGVMNDQAGPYSSHTGAGSVDAARMAIEDFGGSVLGSPIELVAADHQNKPDVGLVIARRWFDTEGVDVIVDVPTSSVALAVQQLVRDRQKLVLFSGPGASDVLVTESFYWDQNDETRAWSKRFLAHNETMPTMLHAGVYGALTHYLKAVASAWTGKSAEVRATMAKLPINDFMTRDGQIRADGRVLRDFYVFEVKTPKETRGPWDYYKLVETVPASRAVVPVAESQCELLRPKPSR